MGANVWQRDAAASGGGRSFSVGSAAQRPDSKRKLVWKRDAGVGAAGRRLSSAWLAGPEP
jgi:hypothetical protein